MKHSLSDFAAKAALASPSRPSVEGGARLGTAPSVRGGPSSGPPRGAVEHLRLSPMNNGESLAMSPEQRKRNLRLALILASIAAVFLAGFVAKMLWLGAR